MAISRYRYEATPVCTDDDLLVKYFFSEKTCKIVFEHAVHILMDRTNFTFKKQSSLAGQRCGRAFFSRIFTSACLTLLEMELGGEWSPCLLFNCVLSEVNKPVIIERKWKGVLLVRDFSKMFFDDELCLLCGWVSVTTMGQLAIN